MDTLTRSVRILMTTDAVGGVWRYAVDTCGRLAANGFEVALVGLGPKPLEPQREEAKRAGVPLFWLDADLDWMVETAKDLQFAASKLDRFIRDWKPTILHLNSPALAAYLEPGPARLIAMHSCVATWWRAVKNKPLPSEWAWHKQAIANGLAESEVATAPSEAFAAALRKTYGPLPQLRVVRNGGTTIEPAAKEPFVLSAGRWWDEGKNLGVLDAAAYDAKWPIYVAGPLTGPNQANIAPSMLHWLGDLPHRELCGWYAKAPIFVSTSVYEPFGLSVLEAASAGAALVLADNPTFRELWSYSAILVDPYDPARVAEAVNLLANNEELRTRLAAAARNRARSYSMERQVKGLTAAYEAAVSTRTMAA